MATTVPAEGDVVKIGNGRARWLVTRMVISANGTPVAGLRSERGRTCCVLAERLTILERAAPSPATALTDGHAVEWRDDGVVFVDGEQVRNPDHYVAVVAEWANPKYTGHEPDHVGAVSVEVCRADLNGDRWLDLRVHNPGEFGNVPLRQNEVLTLAHELLRMANYLGGGRTPLQ